MTRKNSRIGDWLVQEGLLDPDTVEVIERERQRTAYAFFRKRFERGLSTKKLRSMPSRVLLGTPPSTSTL